VTWQNADGGYLCPYAEGPLTSPRGTTPPPAPDIQAALAASGACSSFASNGSRTRLCSKAGFQMGVSSGYPDADVLAETLFDGPQADPAKIVRKLTYGPGDSKEASAMESFLRNIDTPLELRELTKAETANGCGAQFHGDQGFV